MSIEPKLHEPKSNPDFAACNEFIVEQLLDMLGDFNIRKIASVTGFNSETTRRYMNGASRISADFIQQACRGFDLDANLVLLGRKTPLQECDLNHLRTNTLLEELGRRILRIEDCAVGQVMVSEHRTPC